MRRAYLLAIAAGIVVFLVISALLARAFSASSAEQSAVTALVRAEARGDVDAVMDSILNCRGSAACQQRAASNAAELKHPGTVSILQFTPSTSFSIAATQGTARVAWNVGGSLPITQCVRVRRTGNVLSGLHVQLLAVTPRLAADAVCPARIT
jgi:hypothetical protein